MMTFGVPLILVLCGFSVVRCWSGDVVVRSSAPFSARSDDAVFDTATVAVQRIMTLRCSARCCERRVLLIVLFTFVSSWWNDVSCKTRVFVCSAYP